LARAAPDRNSAKLLLRAGDPERRAELGEDRTRPLDCLSRRAPPAEPAPNLPDDDERAGEVEGNRHPLVLRERLVQRSGGAVQVVSRRSEQGPAASRGGQRLGPVDAARPGLEDRRDW